MVIYLSIVISIAASAVPTFLELPENRTVLEGGDASFSCNATVNGERSALSYDIGNGAGSSLQSARANITDLSLVNGVVGACVFGEFNTQLLLKRVTREAEGYTVTCSILDGLFFVALSINTYIRSTTLYQLTLHIQSEVGCSPSCIILAHHLIHSTVTPGSAGDGDMYVVLCVLSLCGTTYYVYSVCCHLYPSIQTLLNTASSPTNPPLCWKEKTSPTPLGLMLDQLPPTSLGPGMARSSPVLMLG